MNEPPVAFDEVESTKLNTAVTVFPSFFDPDGGSVEIVSNTDPANGTATCTAFSCVYTPATGFLGSDSFDYTVSDGELTATATITVTVAANEPPVAFDVAESTKLNTPVTVFGSFFDPDGDPVEIVSHTDPPNGTATCAAFSCVYTPATGFLGSDSFDYTVSDGELTATATITVTVAANEPPVAFDVAESTKLNTPVTVFGSFFDPDGDPVEIVSHTDPPNGTATCTAFSCEYTPATGFLGSDSFDYTVSDGELTATATITVTVSLNAPPVASDVARTVVKNTAETLFPAYFDPDGDPVEIVSHTDPANGTATCTAFSCEYTPDLDFVGPDSFDYTVSDGELTDTARFTISVVEPCHPARCIDNGTILLAVNPAGDLNAVDGTGSAAGSGSVGLHFITTGNEATAPGCLCEGWGAADATSGVTGYANEDEGGASGMTVESFSVTDSTAESVVDIQGALRVTHDYHPAAETESLYEVTVTIENTSATPLSDVRYRRVMDWDVEPTAFSEFVTIQGGNAADLLFDSDDGFATANPLGARSSLGFTGDFVDAGPDDHGALFDFGFGALAPGASKTFNIYYGAGETEAEAEAAVNAVDAEVYSFGQPSTPDGPTLGTPNTFVFAFKRVGGDPIFAPVATDDTLTTDEDAGGPVDVLGNDTDPNGDPLSVSSFTQGAHGAVVCTPAGTCTYTPEADFFGSDSFTYTVSDGAGGTDTATVAVTVTAVNDAPVAVADGYGTDEDVPLVVSAPGVLGNDTDVDGDVLSVSAHGAPAHGTVTVGADGSLTYTPAADYCGADSFGYTVSDGKGGSDTATVSITVACVNDAPAAVADNYSTNRNTELTVPAPGVLGNDTDPDGDTLSVVGNTGPAHGSLSANADGSFTYTPARDFCGADSFGYTVSDGNGGSDTATVGITVVCVNDPPVAVDDEYATDEDTPLTVPAPGVLGNDSDPDGDTLSISGHGDPAHGSLSVNADGSFTYTPAANFCGGDSFGYTLSDGNGGSDTATVSITVACVNDPPVAVDDEYATDEDTPLTVSAPGVLGNDSDVDGDTLSVVGNTDPAHGSLSVSADGSFTYTPAANFCGGDSFGYTLSDGNGGSDTATESITVACVNDPPVAVDDDRSTDEDTPLTVPAPGVLGNDTDVDGDTLSISGHGDPAHGSLSVNADGSFTYTPAANFCGGDSFGYTLSDGNGGSDTATVSITVACVNDPPVAVDDEYATDEDTPLTVPAPGVLGNDTDVDGDTLSVSGHGDPAHGSLALNADGSFTYTPDSGYVGPDEFTYTVDDGNGGSDVATVSITVNGASATFTLTVTRGGSGTGEVTGPGIDCPDDCSESYPEGTEVTLQAVADSGSVFTGWSGDCTGPGDCAVTMDDDRAVTASFGTAGPNHIPYAVDDFAPAHGIGPAHVAVLLNDTDIDGDDLTIAAFDDLGGKVQCGSSSCTYTPAAGELGDKRFTYTVSDGRGGTARATVTVTVRANRGPFALDDVAQAHGTGTEQIPVVANDSDPEQDLLTPAPSAPGPQHGTVTCGGSTCSYTPPATPPEGPGAYPFEDSFGYTISDGHGGSDAAVVTVTVTRNGDPAAADDVAIAHGTGAETIFVLANDLDPEVDTLDVGAFDSTSAAGGTVLCPDSCIYTPPPVPPGGPGAFPYTDSFSYTADDGHGGSDGATVTVTVYANHDPSAAPDRMTAPGVDAGFEELGVLAPLANDSDPDGDRLDIVEYTQGAHGAVACHPPSNASPWTCTYAAEPGYVGTDSFTYAIADGHGGQDGPALVTVDVSANTGPAARDDRAFAHGTGEQRLDPLANDSDPDADELEIVSHTDPDPALGSVDCGSPTAGSGCTFVPSPGFTGPYPADVTFEYTVSDRRGGESTATVTVTLVENGDPVAADDRGTAGFLKPAALFVLGNDTDPEGDPLKITGFTQGDPARGVVSCGESSCHYRAFPGVFGRDSFTYTVEDGHGGAPATATVYVTVVQNHAPIAVGDDVETTSCPATGSCKLTNLQVPVTVNDSDPDAGDLVRVIQFTDPSAGTVSCSSGSCTYTPDDGFVGTDTFEYRITDDRGGYAWGTVTIEVTANAPPLAADDELTTVETRSNWFSVVANDVDPDGDDLRVVAWTQPANGTANCSRAAPNHFPYTVCWYTAAPGFTGEDSFTYTVSDARAGADTAAVHVVVGANRAPVAVDDVAHAHGEAPVRLDLLGNDHDPDGDPLRIVALSGDHVGCGAAGCFYTPPPPPAGGYPFTDTFTYTVGDGHLTASAEVTVEVVGNSAPIARPDTYPDGDPYPVRAGEATLLRVLANDEDPDGDPFSISDFTPAAHGKVSCPSLPIQSGYERLCSYAADAGYTGEDSFTYTITDAWNASATATVTIEATENSPVVAADDHVDLFSLRTETILVALNDDDADRDGLQIVDYDPRLPATTAAGGHVTCDTSPVRYGASFKLFVTCRYTPPAAPPGGVYPFADTFTYTITDMRGSEDSAAVFVTVHNRPPVAEDDSVVTTVDTQDPVEPVTLPIDVLANDTELDPDDVFTALVPDTTGTVGTVSCDVRFGYCDYTAPLGFVGTDIFTYAVTDSRGGTGTATVTVEVVGNRAPHAVDDYENVAGAGPFSFNVRANDYDDDGDFLVVDGTFVGLQPQHGSASCFTEGCTYTPEPGFSGSDSFEYRVLDGHGGDAVATVYIGVNRPLVLATITSGPNPSVVGQSMTLSATVSAPGAGAPTGSVDFVEGGVVLGTAAVTGGSAGLALATLSVGSHTIVAEYHGDGSFAGTSATSSPVVQVVEKAATTTTLTSAPNPSALGGAVTITATVDPIAPGAGTPTGTVRFDDGATPLGTAALGPDGTASLVTAALTAGDHSLSAHYEGDGSFGSSSSPAHSHLVVESVLSVADASVVEGDDGTTELVLTVTRTGSTALAASVGYATSGGTAVAGEDYESASGVLAFAAGETEQTIPVAVDGDTVFEADETFSLTLTSPANAALGDAEATGTIVNDDDAPTLSIADVSLVESDAGQTLFTFTVTKSGATELPASVVATTSDGTATAGEDYVAASEPLLFAPAELELTFSVPVNGDTALEPDETFTVTLSDPENATLDVSEASGTIVNDDGGNTAPVADAGGDATVAEGSTLGRQGSFADPDDDTWTATVDYGDGGGPEALALAPDKSFALSHVYADDGDYLVTVSVDDGTANTSDSFLVTVTNVAPAVDAGPDAVIEPDAAFTSAGSFVDPGTGDGWTATVDYGDGSGPQPLVLNADKTFALSHVYAAAGEFTVTVTVEDDDGGSGGDTATVTVEAAPTYTVTVSREGAGSGRVTGPGIDCPDDCEGLFAAGTELTLEALPDPGSVFAGWTGACTGTGDCVVTVDDDLAVTAGFVPAPPPSADLSVTQTDAPDPATASNNVNYALTVTNTGPDGATGVTLTDILPAGTTVVSVLPTQGTCAVVVLTLTCNLGSIPVAGTVGVSLTLLLPATSSQVTISNTAGVAGDQADPVPANNASIESTLVNPVSPGQDAVAGWFDGGGGAITTDPGKGPKKANGLTTSVVVPAGLTGLVSIREEAVVACPSGVECLGQQVTVSAPDASVAAPLRITFLLHPTAVPPKVKPADLRVFLGSALVPPCAVATGVASPDPCVLAVESVKGDVRIEVLSSTGGTWRIGR